MGRLTTHVLDTAAGRPAAGLKIELFQLTDATRLKITETQTNEDGRAPAPLLEGDAFKTGGYELIFHAGAYLDATGVVLPDVKFLDLVPVRFGIADQAAHYHVPLLLSPFGYSTYRGS